MAPWVQAGPRRVWLLVLVGVAGIVVLLGAIAAFRLVAVAGDLDDARRLVASAGDAIDAGDLTAAEADLATASDLIVEANNRLHSSVALELVGWLPIVSGNVDVVEDSVGLAMQAALGGSELLAASDPLEAPDGRFEIPLAAGAIPVDAVAKVQDELAALAAVLPTADELPAGRFILPAVRDARADLYEEASQRREQADVLSRALDVLVDMSGGNGPRRYLIAVADTGQMRGSGGTIRDYGVLTGRDGRFALEEFGSIEDLELTTPVPEDELPAVPDDYLARWQGFDPLLRWRNANMAADFELVAPVLEAMYEQATGDPVDGVIQIDAQGLAAVLDSIGPVTVAGLGEVTSGDLVERTIDPGGRDGEAGAGPGTLGAVAEAVFRQLVEGDHQSLRPLADALVRAVTSRHIQVHTPVGTALAQLRSFDATGSLPRLAGGDTFHLTVQNLSGHELDHYLDTDLSLTGRRPAGQRGHIEATVTLANGAPPGQTEPTDVFVPTDPEQPSGSYRAVVSLYAPRGATLVSFDGAVIGGPEVAAEGGRPVVSFTVDIGAGERRSFGLELSLPAASVDSPYVLVAVPAPRVRPTTFRTDIETHAGPVAGEVVLDRSWRFRPRRPPAPVDPRG